MSNKEKEAFRKGFKFAKDHAEVNTWDGWQETDAYVDFTYAERMLEEELSK